MRVMPLERVPPQSTEAEQGVLGSTLLERDAIARVVEMIRGDDFYREAHRRIYETMVDLFERGEPVDLITVTDRLKARGQLEDVGGAAYVTSLLDAVPTAANVEYYARLVLQKSPLRQLIAAGTDIVGMGFREEQEVEVLLDQAEKLVFGIASRRMAQDFVPIRDVLQESFDRIDKRYQDKGTTTGVPTGFTDINLITAGLHPADLIIVAARPAPPGQGQMPEVRCRDRRRTDGRRPHDPGGRGGRPGHFVFPRRVHASFAHRAQPVRG